MTLLERFVKYVKVHGGEHTSQIQLATAAENFQILLIRQDDCLIFLPSVNSCAVGVHVHAAAEKQSCSHKQEV